MHRHLAFIDFFIKQNETVQRKQKQEKISTLNILYVFSICSPKERYRKTFREVNAYKKEILRLKEIYLDQIIEEIPKYKAEDLIKLILVIKNLRIFKHDQLFKSLENLLEKNLSQFPHHELAYILYLGSKSNKNQGIFSR